MKLLKIILSAPKTIKVTSPKEVYRWQIILKKISISQVTREMQIKTKVRYYYKSIVCCAQSCPTLWDPVDCSPPSSFDHGIFQASMLEWVAISSSRESSWPRDWTQVSCIGGWILYQWAAWKPTHLLQWQNIWNTDNSKCWRGCEARWALIHCWWECKTVGPLRRTIWWFLTKVNILFQRFISKKPTYCLKKNWG